jgi:hypothetical protein
MLLFAAAVVAAQDHVGKPLPDYVTGDECLFCHDRTIGLTWQTNPHAWTIRPVGIPPAASTPPRGASHVLGDGTRVRWLALSGYGRFDLLAADGKTWQSDVFAKRCVGCHTTAVDPKTRAFSCHGAVPSGHTGDTAQVWLSKKHGRTPRLVVSICGQCHLRGARSVSSGLPYANNFVAGDDLFADFRMDLSAGEGHVYRNVRDVLERGSDVTCLSCHRVHGDSSRKRSPVRSPVCEY